MQQHTLLTKIRAFRLFIGGTHVDDDEHEAVALGVMVCFASSTSDSKLSVSASDMKIFGRLSGNRPSITSIGIPPAGHDSFVTGLNCKEKI